MKPAKTMYFIPQNYRDQGLLMGLFHQRHVLQAVVWVVPLTFLVFNIFFLPIGVRGFIWIMFVLLPGFLLLTGQGAWLFDIINFYRKRRIYYHVPKGYEDVFLYQRMLQESKKKKG